MKWVGEGGFFEKRITDILLLKKAFYPGKYRSLFHLFALNIVSSFSLLNTIHKKESKKAFDFALIPVFGSKMTCAGKICYIFSILICLW